MNRRDVWLILLGTMLLSWIVRSYTSELDAAYIKDQVAQLWGATWALLIHWLLCRIAGRA